jgi:hypothetical protein
MTDIEFDRDVGLRIMIDTNMINSRGRNADMNQLEAWGHTGVIDIVLPEPAHEEATADDDPRRVAKANAHVISESLARTTEERRILDAIAQTIFPSVAPNRNQANDIEIVFNSWKYVAILVTNDGDSRSQPRGILGSRAGLEKLAIRVMRPSEAVTEVRRKIAVRDSIARQSSESHSCAPPAWVGND